MTELTNQLQLSIMLERIKQTLKTASDLAKQMQARSAPSAKCNSFIAQEMHKDFEIWESAQVAADKALEDLAATAEVVKALITPAVKAEDVIPDLICKVCRQPAVATINHICWDCYELITGLQSIEPCNDPCCAGTVLQMKRRGQ